MDASTANCPTYVSHTRSGRNSLPAPCIPHSPPETTGTMTTNKRGYREPGHTPGVPMDGVERYEGPCGSPSYTSKDAVTAKRPAPGAAEDEPASKRAENLQGNPFQREGTPGFEDLAASPPGRTWLAGESPAYCAEASESAASEPAASEPTQETWGDPVVSMEERKAALKTLFDFWRMSPEEAVMAESEAAHTATSPEDYWAKMLILTKVPLPPTYKDTFLGLTPRPCKCTEGKCSKCIADTLYPAPATEPVTCMTVGHFENELAFLGVPGKDGLDMAEFFACIEGKLGFAFCVTFYGGPETTIKLYAREFLDIVKNVETDATLTYDGKCYMWEFKPEQVDDDDDDEAVKKAVKETLEKAKKVATEMCRQIVAHLTGKTE